MPNKRDVRIMYTIYDHISPSGKHYVGQTSMDPVKRWGYKGYRYFQKRDGKLTQRIFANAITKYGWDAFEHKILFTGLTKLDADMIEQDLIFYYKKQGISYNNSDGGEGAVGVKMSEDGKRRLREANKGKKLSKETRDRMSESRKKPISQYTKDGTFIKEYDSTTQAVKETGIDGGSISNVLTGKRKSAGGYVWKYV